MPVTSSPSPDAPRILFYVQHLLGIGHLKRASLLVKGWLDAGFDVWVASGGEPVAQFGFGRARYIQLPPIKASDSNFSTLTDAEGRLLDDGFKNRRRQALLAAFEQCRADILMIENFPFGRRQLRWELIPLLEAADRRRPRPVVVCSIRDVLQERKPERVQETVALVQRYFDRVQIHGDENFIPLSCSFPATDRIADRIGYTGYVAEPQEGGEQLTEGTSPEGCDEVLVSAGGGAVGLQLMQTALKARALNGLDRYRWRLLLGPNLPRADIAKLQALSAPGVVLEPIRSDFPRLLGRCRLSVSQAGYNTVMDLLQSGAPALLVPFEGEGETEQRLRAQRLAQLDGFAMLTEAQLRPEVMASALGQLLERPADRGKRSGLPRLDGVEQSARQLYRYWQQQGGRDERSG